MTTFFRRAISVALGLAAGLSAGHHVEGVAHAAETVSTTFGVAPSLVTTAKKLLQAKGASVPVTIQGYPLPDGRTAPVILQAFPLWAHHSVISVRAGDQPLGSGRPRSTTQLLGRIKNSASTVQLRLTDEGLTGFSFYKGRLYRQAFGDSHVTFEAMATTAVDRGEPGAACALGTAPKAGEVGEPSPKPAAPASAKLGLGDYLATLDPVKPPSGADVLSLGFCCVGGPGGQPVKFFDLAVETDDELGVEYTGHLGLVQRRVEDVIAAVNAIYWNGETGVIFRLRWLLIHWGLSVGEEVQDPYGGNSFARVGILRDLWNTEPTRVAMTAVNRDLTLLMSGATLGGNNIFFPWECVTGGQSTGQSCSTLGAACGNGGTCGWVGESLCRKDKAYAVVERGDLDTVVNATAHELGHLFGVEHAHCTDTAIPASIPPASPVDRCETNRVSMRNQACFVGTVASPPNYVATVMSTCPALFNGIELGLDFHDRSAALLGDAAQQAACGKQATVVPLQNGQPVLGLSSTSVEQYYYFAINVPSGASRLRVETRGSGELGLYVRYGTLPTTWGTLVSSLPGTADQQIEATAPRAGWWYVLLLGPGAAGFSGVEVRAEHQ